MSTLADRMHLALAHTPGKTQADLARAVGVKQPSVNAWFSGETKTLKGSSARKAADFFGCSRDWLETGRGDPGWSTGLDGSTIAPPDHLVDALRNWRLQASHRSVQTIDHLIRLAETGALKDKDWQLIDELAARLQRR